MTTISLFAFGGADDQVIPEGNKVIKIGAPKAPPIIPIFKMMEDKALGKYVSIVLDYWETPEK